MFPGEIGRPGYGYMMDPNLAPLPGGAFVWRPPMQRKRRVPFAIWVTLWAIIVIAALALIITVVAWFAIP